MTWPRPIDMESLGGTDRFWSKVRIAGPDDCWTWSGGSSRGYGHFLLDSRGTRNVYAHRVAWALTYGSIPDGLLVLHKCDRPRCCNPAHLFLGTYADNSADMVAKGRARNGARA